MRTGLPAKIYLYQWTEMGRFYYIGISQGLPHRDHKGLGLVHGRIKASVHCVYSTLVFKVERLSSSLELV